MASIAKRPNGQWRARYRDPDGREHARHFARKVDAQRWLDEATAGLVTGQYVDPRAGRVTFREYAEQWRAAAPHGPAMRDKVARALERHVYPAMGEWPISAIRPSALQAWVTGLPLAPSTAKVVLTYVGGIFRAAVRDRVIAVNPTEGVRPPAARKAEVYIPGLAVVQGVREALPPRYRGVIDVVLGAGLRQGEVFGLDVAALDFLRCRALTVRQQLVSLSPEPLYLGPPKTAESERTIPLAPRTLDALAAHLAEHPAASVEIEDRTDPKRPRLRGAHLVFSTDAGSPISRSMWSQIWRPAARAAGVPERVGLHALRHFYASALIAHGESVKVVQKRLGHSSAAVTLDIYAHLWPDSDDRTREAVEFALADVAAPCGLPADIRKRAWPLNSGNRTGMRFFYDCEFIEDGMTIDLVSIGVVGEDGREFYAVSTEFDGGRAGAWVRANVLPKLPSPADPAWRSRDRLRADLLAFLTGAPGDVELWAWIAAYDHVALCQLWGAMPALPRALPRFTRELRQRWEDAGKPPLPPPTADAHDALADARLNLLRWEAIEAAARVR